MALGKCYNNDLKQATIDALELSKNNPTNYYVLINCFGIYISCRKYLGIFAPSESITSYYFKNGKQKEFTKAQIINDQNKTPTIY